jgi:hypothetical protein
MKEALRSSQTSVLTRATRRNIPEDAILHNHLRENLKSDKTEILVCLIIFWLWRVSDSCNCCVTTRRWNTTPYYSKSYLWIRVVISPLYPSDHKIAQNVDIRSCKWQNHIYPSFNNDTRLKSLSYIETNVNMEYLCSQDTHGRPGPMCTCIWRGHGNQKLIPFCAFLHAHHERLIYASSQEDIQRPRARFTELINVACSRHQMLFVKGWW